MSNAYGLEILRTITGRDVLTSDLKQHVTYLSAVLRVLSRPPWPSALRLLIRSLSKRNVAIVEMSKVVTEVSDGRWGDNFQQR